MRRHVLMAAVVGAAAGAASAAMAADDEPGARHPAGFEEAIREAGLQDAPSVRGEYVARKGWQVESAAADGDGWVGYAPIGAPDR